MKNEGVHLNREWITLKSRARRAQITKGNCLSNHCFQILRLTAQNDNKGGRDSSEASHQTEGFRDTKKGLALSQTLLGINY